MEQSVVITAVGQDQPGIIAAVTEAVFQLGGNLDDATMTRLNGAFATMVSARLSGGKTQADVERVLAPVAEKMGVTITVQTVNGSDLQETPPDHMITVYGADKPGIVYQVTQRLAAHGVNITDMDTRLAGTAASPVYVMLLEVAAGGSDLKEDLAGLGAELGVDVTIQALDTEAL